MNSGIYGKILYDKSAIKFFNNRIYLHLSFNDWTSTIISLQSLTTNYMLNIKDLYHSK